MRCLFVALDDHWHDGLPDDFLAHLAITFLETIQRDHSFGHRAMAAGAADVVVELLHDVTGAPDVADIAHGDDHAILDQSGYHSPLDALDVQTKLRHLRDNILSVDLAHVDHGHPVIQLQAAERPPESFQIFTRQGGPLDPSDHRLFCKGIEKSEWSESGENAAPFEKKCIRLDSVEQRGRQSLRRLHPDGPQILREDRGRRTIAGSKGGKTGFGGGPLRVRMYP